MNRMIKIFIVGLFLLAVLQAPGFCEEFLLKSGEKLNGELISYEGTTFRVKSKFGVLSIEEKDLAVIGFNTKEGVLEVMMGTPTKNDRDRVKGTLETVREGEFRIKTDYGYVVINALDKLSGIGLTQDSSALGSEIGQPGSKEVPAGKRVQFDSKTAMGKDEYVQIAVNSLTILKDGRIQLDIDWENINEEKLPMEIKILDPQTRTYLIDNLGNEYLYVESSTITEREILVRPGVKKSASFIFPKIQNGATGFTLYLDYWGQREGRSSFDDRLIIEGLDIK